MYLFINLFFSNFYIAGWLLWSWCSSQATGWNDLRVYLKPTLSNHANSIRIVYKMPVRWKKGPKRKEPRQEKIHLSKIAIHSYLLRCYRVFKRYSFFMQQCTIYLSFPVWWIRLNFARLFLTYSVQLKDLRHSASNSLNAKENYKKIYLIARRVH